MTKKRNRNTTRNMLEGQVGTAGNTRKGSNPEWAQGLRQLYDSVVDEPLPDSFMDLLSRLDDSKQ